MNDIVYEEQKQIIKMWKDKYYEKKEEIERLHSIIKEVREKCEEEIKEGRSEENTWLMGIYDNSKDILEILDKVDKENK